MSRSFKFRRQHRIGDLIVDFYCAEARLAIEIDGAIHDGDLAADRELRDARLRAQGVHVVHFTNGEVATNIADVVRRIEDLCCFS